MTTQPTVVLVHSPLVSPLTWAPVAEALTSAGWPVNRPALTDVVTDEGPYYGTLAATVAEAISGPSVIVGHSAAGALLPVIAAAATEPPRAVVFVDAVLPHPGQNWFDTAPDDLVQQLRGMARHGLLPTWDQWFPPGALLDLIPDPALHQRFVDELPEVPLAYFEETAPAVAPLPDHRCGYLLLSEPYQNEAAAARGFGWRVDTEPSDHLAMLTQPTRIAGALTRMLTALVGDVSADVSADVP
ncbi:MAG TPA: alpha/beta fold hydrolase [Pseudonocardiaceae bacterium]|jgi:hypothetical protein|nr:alpha/beta fold hydrolase [Pseudonocardiaceae bacterium]